MEKEYVTLSASRIKTLDTCSWIYYCNYILRLPDVPNDGAKRGTVTHLVLECLLKDKHRKHYDKIMEDDCVVKCPPVWRLVKKEAAKLGVDDEENLALIEGFILVGLKEDFFCESEGQIIEGTEDDEYGKADLLPPEKKFKITKDDPKYEILGFIDKICLYPESKTIKVVDYKTSKVKFSGDEKTFNIQSLLYSVAALQLFPEYEKVVCEFLFLKFPRKPVMRFCYSDKQLGGFEQYLEHVNKFLCEFSMVHANSSFAKDSKKNYWLCGKFKGDKNVKGEPAFICKFKYAYDYWAVVSRDNGKVLKTAFMENRHEVDKYAEKLPEGSYDIETRHYGGCPKFRKKLKGQTR